MKLEKLFLRLVLPLWVLACGASAVPTPTPIAVPTFISVAELPTIEVSPTPTITVVAPTRNLTPEATATPLPTLTPPLPRATVTPAPVDTVIQIQNPTQNTQFQVGEIVKVSGFAQLNEGEGIWVSLLTWDGRLLLDVPANVEVQSLTNRTIVWNVDIQLPVPIAGSNRLLATVRNALNQSTASSSQTINLGVDLATAERYITLSEPLLGANVIAGHYVLLKGTVYRPANNRIGVEIYTNNCRDMVTDISFVINGSGDWYGLPTLPDDAVGPACLVVHTGNRGEGAWREIQVPLNILAKDDFGANGIMFMSPIDEVTIKSGSTLRAWGLAYNAVDQKLKVSVFLADGPLVAQIEDVAVDRYGYWEVDVPIPPLLEGEAVLEVITGEAGDFGHAQTKQQILILLGDFGQ